MLNFYPSWELEGHILKRNADVTDPLYIAKEIIIAKHFVACVNLPPHL